MGHMVLGLGYQSADYETVRSEWRAHDVDFHFVDTTEEVIQRLGQEDYVCVTICTGHIDSNQLVLMRSMRPVTTVELSPKCSVAQRAENFQQGAV